VNVTESPDDDGTLAADIDMPREFEVSVTENMNASQLPIDSQCSFEDGCLADDMDIPVSLEIAPTELVDVPESPNEYQFARENCFLEADIYMPQSLGKTQVSEKEFDAWNDAASLPCAVHKGTTHVCTTEVISHPVSTPKRQKRRVFGAVVRANCRGEPGFPLPAFSNQSESANLRCKVSQGTLSVPACKLDNIDVGTGSLWSENRLGGFSCVTPSHANQHPGSHPPSPLGPPRKHLSSLVSRPTTPTRQGSSPPPLLPAASLLDLGNETAPRYAQFHSSAIRTVQDKALKIQRPTASPATLRSSSCVSKPTTPTSPESSVAQPLPAALLLHLGNDKTPIRAQFHTSAMGTFQKQALKTKGQTITMRGTKALPHLDVRFLPQIPPSKRAGLGIPSVPGNQDDLEATIWKRHAARNTIRTTSCP